MLLGGVIFTCQPCCCLAVLTVARGVTLVGASGSAPVVLFAANFRLMRVSVLDWRNCAQKYSF